MSAKGQRPPRAAPEVVLDLLDDVADRWVRDGHASRYADALIDDGGYVVSDARYEASYVETMMRSQYLSPFVLRGPGDSMNALAERCRAGTEDGGAFILGSGNSGVPVILNALVGLVLGRSLYIRPSRANGKAFGVWVDALASCTRGLSSPNPFHDRIVRLEVAHDSPDYFSQLSELPVSVAFLWGGAIALEATAACLTQVPPARRHFFGPRTGVLVLEASWWATRDAEQRRLLAQACYDNLMMYDAALCSSPTFGVVVGELDDGRRMLDEVAACMVPDADERVRLARLPDATARLRQMSQWVAQGYSLHRPHGSVVAMALGRLVDYHRKNRYLPTPGAFHDSAGSLELLAFTESELPAMAELLAHLQSEPRYDAELWSIGHIITAASVATTAKLMAALETALAAAPGQYVLPSQALRVVDVRSNIGREPGTRLDGISLHDAMLSGRTALS